MERCIYQLKCICHSLDGLRILLLCLYNVKEFFVNVAADYFKQALILSLVKRDEFNIIKNIIAVNCRYNNVSRVGR